MNSSNSKSTETSVDFYVSSQDGDKYRITMKRNVKLEKMMRKYCKEKKLDYNTVIFLYDGKKVNPSETPEEIGLEDGDEMDAFMHQTGGGGGGLDCPH